MDEAEAYLKRGRTYAGLTANELNERWTAAYRLWFRARSSENQIVVDDLGAELALRRLLPPYKTVAAELAEAQAEIIAEGPRNPNLRRRIQDYLDKKDGPKN